MPAITLRADHLPPSLANLLDAYTQASQAAVEARRALDTAPIQERHELTEPAEKAHTAAVEALGALEAATARSNQQLRDSASGAYFSHVEAARTALATAEQEMRSAAAAAGLYATATARPGRRVLNIEGDAAGRSKGKQRAMLCVSEIREVLGQLPDAVD
ncbi:hypothetical protein [Streptomyces sp. HUAS ZL42]|uniref:hypothetical protein n=1 Tax=Streptomyces sp. HUAS ZL42 TaxID=3231715 RepID=UPI00345EC61B